MPFSCLFSRYTLSLLFLLCVSAVSSQASENKINETVPACDFGGLVFDLGFSSARLSSCKQTGKREYSLSTSPENEPVNHSPWYAFRVFSEKKQNITVYLHYTVHQHRYYPKLSSDGKAWVRLDDKNLKVLFDGKAIKFELEVGPDPIWVSAQEILDNAYYDRWIDSQISEYAFLSGRVLGKSLQGRNVRLIETTSNRKKYVVFVGRQHPPEVTGAIAMAFFVERLMQDDDLARSFRQKYGMVIVPNMNPDGVELGNWRHNAGGVDLNRDWGPFAQPETRLIRKELSRFQKPDAPQIDLFLDFHSTAHDVFYTQDKPTQRFPEFTDTWLGNLQAQLNQRHPDYVVGIKPGHNPDLAVSKSYMNETFGIPAITFELGDETDRALIKDIAETAAEEMMKLLINNQ